jgi:signal transduction histidine kinase/PAS domain-containing protein
MAHHYIRARGAFRIEVLRMLNDRPSTPDNPEHSRLLKALRESELLRELAELLASSLDPTHILQVLVRRTTEACEVERCAVWLLDAQQARFRPSAYHFSTQHLNGKIVQAVDRMWRHSSLPFDHPIIDRLLGNNGVLAIEDLCDEPSMQLLAEKFFVSSVLLIALVREGRPVGMMSLDNPGRTMFFTREQQQLARAIGQQAAVAIDNARLYQQAHDEQKRAERLVERAHSIYQVAMAANSGEDLTQVLNVATRQLVHGGDAQSAAIALLKDEHLHIASATFTHPPLSNGTNPLLPSIHTIPHCQKATAQENPLFVSWEQFTPLEQRWFRQLGMTHVLIVPLLVVPQNAQGTRSAQITRNGRLPHKAAQAATEQHCIGFAFVSYRQKTPSPSEGKLVFARDIAAQCALAIEKARILAEARQAVTLATERANTLDAVFNAMTEGILVLDLEGRRIHSNSSASLTMPLADDIPRYLAKYLQHNPTFTLYGQPVPLDDYPLMRALRGERIRGERYLSRRRDGNEHALEVNIVPLFASDEKQIGIVAAFHDITEQVRVEQRIRRALDTMLHAAEAVSGVMNTREMLYRVLAMTLAALNCERGIVQLYTEEDGFTPLLSIGFAPDEANQWLDEQHYWPQPEQHHDAGLFARLLEGHATLLDVENDHTDHLQGPILATPITHNNRLLGVILLDRAPSQTKHPHQPRATGELPTLGFNAWDMAVVEGIGQFAGLAMEQTRWKQEAEIARTNEATMRETNAMKDEFLAITAHEFRTPLTVILAHSQMMGRLLQRSTGVPPELQGRMDESLSFIEEQARQLTNIVNTFLEVTRLNRGQITLAQEEVQLEEVVKEAVAHYSATVTNHTLRYRIKPAELPYVSLGDRARLSQIFANLLQNAIKYSPLGGPITVTLAQRTDENGKKVIEARVEDKGIGVPKDAQPYLFERFYRAPNIGGSQARGVGLGLYLVAEFLHLHGGTIRVESNGVEGEGSRFIFTLPLLESAS